MKLMNKATGVLTPWVQHARAIGPFCCPPSRRTVSKAINLAVHLADMYAEAPQHESMPPCRSPHFQQPYCRLGISIAGQNSTPSSSHRLKYTQTHFEVEPLRGQAGLVLTSLWPSRCLRVSKVLTIVAPSGNTPELLRARGGSISGEA